MTTASTSRRPGWVVPVVVAAVAILAVVIGLILANVIGQAPGTGSGTPSASPSASPEPSVPGTPTPEPTETPEPTPTLEPEPTPVVDAPDDFLPPGSIARLLSDADMYGEPRTDAEILMTLDAEDLVGVGYSYLHPDWGPVEADGITWYPVRPLYRSDLPPVPSGPFSPTPALGWVDGSSLELADARCVSDEPTLEILESLVPWEQLACYGDQTITIEGTFGCGGCGGFQAGEFEPLWLASPMHYDLLSVDPQERIGPFQIFFPPDMEAPDGGSILSVTGHFSDAIAAECSIAPGEPPVAIDDEVAELFCRERFVVESFEVLGVDEDFPFS